MRKLGLKDAFSIARIIKNSDLKSEIVSLGAEVQARQAKGEKLNAEDVGLEFVVNIITALSDKSSEEEFYKLYADIKGSTTEDVALTDFATLRTDVKELIEQNDLKSFFRSASSLM